MKKVLVVINGILNRPGKCDAWTDEAVDWANIHSDYKAIKLEYWTGPLTRRLCQQSKARHYATIIQKYLSRGWAVTIAAHSNGADLVIRILNLLPHAHFHKIHLFAGAAEYRQHFGPRHQGKTKLGRIESSITWNRSNFRGLHTCARLAVTSTR